MRTTREWIVAAALAALGCTADPSVIALPVCAEGCVEGPCADSYPSTPGQPTPGPHFPILGELESADCVAMATDGLGRTTEYLCFGVAETQVTYWGDTELPQTVSQVETIRNGSVVQQLVFDLEWDDSAHLVLERVRTYWDGQWNGSEASYQTVYAPEGTITETHRRTRFEEPDGPEESGDHHQAFFNDDGVERAHHIERWNARSQLTRSELRAGLAEVLASETDYTWSDARLLRVTATRLVEDPSEEQQGCSKPDPNHIHCTAELSYDDEGRLLSFVEAGTTWVVSDHCCGHCVAE